MKEPAAAAAAAGDGVRAMLSRPIQLADQLAATAKRAAPWRPECADIAASAERLAAVLRQMARAESIYERPAERILAEAASALGKALALVERLRSGSRFRRMFALVPASALDRALDAVEQSVEDLNWLLKILTAPASDDDEDVLHAIPSTARIEPHLSWVWGTVARLHNGTPAARANAASWLASLARDDSYAVRIIEEDGVPPLVRLLKDGTADGQAAAAEALAVLARYKDGVHRIVHAGGCTVLVQLLKRPPMRVQAAAAEVVGEMARSEPSCREQFDSIAVHILIGHLAHETLQEHSLYAVARTKHFDTVVQTAIAAKSSTVAQRPRADEDAATKTKMKSMAAYALWRLATGSESICKLITESRALLCFAALLDSDAADVRRYSALALMEITRVAEHSLALRQAAFKPSSPPARAVLDQLLRVARRAAHNDNLLLPSITALGCLARTFTAKETRVIPALVQLLDAQPPVVAREAAVALTKFVSSDHHWHVLNSNGVVEAGGARHVVHLVYFGDEAQREALKLLCYLALHVPESPELAEAGVLSVLLWAKQVEMMADSPSEALLDESIERIGLFQSRAGR